MLRKRCLLLLMLLMTVSLYAQVGMNLKADKERYLRYEPIEVKLTLRNYSGNTLIFGKSEEGEKDQSFLRFYVKSHDGSSVRPLSTVINPLEDMVFAPGETKELSLRVNDFYDMQKEDFYNVTAVVEHKRMPKAYSSNPISFEVREGTIILTKTIGMPTEKEEDAIKSINASLMRFNDGTDDIYCLRIDDDKLVYGTFRIGPCITGSTPQLDADGASAIHVLVQVRPRLYCYSIYSIIQGVAKLRQQRYYKPDNGVPTLSRATGYLKVLYAVQAVEGTDFRYGKENWKK